MTDHTNSTSSFFFAAVCVEGEVRPLIGGTTAAEGLVEVCAGGTFSLVDLNSVTITEASVLCRQLNLGSGNLSTCKCVIINLPRLLLLGCSWISSVSN